MNTLNPIRTGELNSIALPSSKVREYRNAALNIMEEIKHTNETYGACCVALDSHQLNVPRLHGESQLNHLDRIVGHLAVIEGEIAKSEILKEVRVERDQLSKPHVPANEHELPIHRQKTKFGRILQSLANRF